MTICTPEGIDRVSKIVAGALGIKTTEDIASVRAERLVILDTSGPEQLPAGIDFSNAIIVDHHSRNPRWEGARIYYSDDSKGSCAEIVYELLKTAGKQVPRDVALALLLGIATDTGMFKFARPRSLAAFAELMETHSIDMDEVTGLIGLETDISEKISQLKGAQRLKFWRVGEHIVASSYGSAFEASVCKALLSLGADVAFVGSQRDDRFRISGRASQAMVRKGIHLGRLMGNVGKETSNGGGGHPGAAGITGTGDVEAILNMLVEEISKTLTKLNSSGD